MMIYVISYKGSFFFNYRKRLQGYSFDKSFPSLICHSVTLRDVSYAKTRNIQKSVSVQPREILSTYIIYKDMDIEIELRVLTGKKEVEEGWTNTASLQEYALFEHHQLPSGVLP